VSAPAAPYLVVSDFDGTITLLEMIARGYGDVAHPPETLLAEVIPRGRWRPGFEAFVAMCDARRWPFEVLSHGLTFYIQPLLPTGVALTAFEGRFQDGRWRVELPAGVDVPAGHDFKAHVVATLHARHPGHTTVYIGDGRLDFPAARTCDRVFAVRDSTLARLLLEANVPFTPFDDFDEVAILLASG
jgi:2-hydroxy-3-keto-5-methylthiopentenyl-1-phosphate phosphatase